MAITNYLVHFLTEDTYNSKKSELRNDAVAFVKDATIIHTHGTDYYCGSGPVALKSDIEPYIVQISEDMTQNTASSETISTNIGGWDNLSNAIVQGKTIVLESTTDQIACNALQVDTNTIQLSLMIYAPSLDSSIFACQGVTFTITNTNGTLQCVYSALMWNSSSVIQSYIVHVSNLVSSSSSSEITTAIGNWDSLFNAIKNKNLIINQDDNEMTPLYAELNEATNTIVLSYAGATALTSAVSGKCWAFQKTDDGQTTMLIQSLQIAEHTSSIYSGGVKLGFSESGNNFALKTNDNNEAYITVPISNYLPLTGGTLTGVLTLNGDSSSGNVIELDNDNVQSFNIVSDGKDVNIKTINTSLSVTSEGVVISGDASNLITLNGSAKSQRIYSSSSISIVSGLATLRLEGNSGLVTIDDSVILTEDNYSNYITTTDTKNTAGSSNSLSKLFLIGASSQSSTGVQTYSNSDVYMQDGNLLLKNGDLSVSNSGTLFGGKLNIRSGIFLVNSEQVTFNPAGSDTFSLYYNDGISLTLNDSIGSFTVNGGVGNFSDKVNAVNGFYETSDARLKNFKDDVKALEIISEIPTKYFTWKKDEVNENMDPQLHIGTSAQEIQKIYPDLVTANEDGILSVDYARLSIIALAAIKELKAEIDELKANK